MDIKWEADDGYAGGSAPQSLRVTDDEILDCDSVDSAMELIEESIRNDFLEKVTWTCDLEEVRTKVEKLFKSKGED